MDLLGRTPWLRVALALFIVGYGANQFAPLLLVYRREDGLTEPVVTAMFGAYALGLMPALIVAAVLAGRLGHRAVVRPVLVLAVAGSVLLAVGESSPALLFAGRVLYGITTGAVMAPGTTWIKELSADSPSGTGARRAAIALSAGFGGGPLLSGFIAEYLPAPRVLPYVVHIALAVLVAAVAWNAPVPAGPGRAPVTTSDEPTRRHFAASGYFWAYVAPLAPWVFTCATLGLVVGPSLVRDGTGHFAVAFTGLMAGVTLGVGVWVQQPARRLAARRSGLVALVGAAATVVGVLLLIPAARTGQPVFAVMAAVVLGCGYGLMLVGGLTRVEQGSPPDQLAMSNAVFYCLTYLGFAAPTVISLLTGSFAATTVLLGFAGLAVASGCFAIAGLLREQRPPG